MKKIYNSILFCFLSLCYQTNIWAQQNSLQQKVEAEKELTDGTRCGGVERWNEKVLVDSKSSQVNYTPVLTTIDSLVQINTPSPDPNAIRITGLEYKTYKFRCHITIKKYESDNDYHLVLSDGTNTLIGEVPDPVCASAAMSAHVNEYIAARQFVDAHIAQGDVNYVNIPDVSITGVLFLDPPHGQTGKAPNNVEIHPILDIHFWTTSDDINILEIPLLKVNIRPNIFSTSSKLQIETTKDILGKCKMNIFSTDGRMIKEIELTHPDSRSLTQTINRDNLSTGAYIYRIINNDLILYEGKFIIQ